MPMPQTTLETLQQARLLILNPQQWTQGRLARDRFDTPTLCNGPNAVCWCASGALLTVCSYGVTASRNHDLIRSAEEALCIVMLDTVPAFNDNHTHAEVINAFDKAITKLQRATQ